MYTITVCKYGAEVTLWSLDKQHINEDTDYGVVDEYGEVEENYVSVQDARVIVTDDKGNTVYDDVPSTYDHEEDATQYYTNNTYLTEVGWRTQEYTSETLPTYTLVNFGTHSLICLNTGDMEFDSSWDGRYAECWKTDDN